MDGLPQMDCDNDQMWSKSEKYWINKFMLLQFTREYFDGL